MIKKSSKGELGCAHDLVMTPMELARQIIEQLPIKPNETLLEPAKGNGAFYDNFPVKNKKYWCEISCGVDFFSYMQKVDWIITNPPYSIFDRFIEHSFLLSNNVVFLCPLSKFVNSMGRMRLYKKYGGAVKIIVLAAARCGFPFGFPCAVIWFKRGYKGDTRIEIL